MKDPLGDPFVGIHLLGHTDVPVRGWCVMRGLRACRGEEAVEGEIYSAGKMQLGPGPLPSGVGAQKGEGREQASNNPSNTVEMPRLRAGAADTVFSHSGKALKHWCHVPAGGPASSREGRQFRRGTKRIWLLPSLYARVGERWKNWLFEAFICSIPTSKILPLYAAAMSIFCCVVVVFK